MARHVRGDGGAAIFWLVLLVLVALIAAPVIHFADACGYFDYTGDPAIRLLKAVGELVAFVLILWAAFWIVLKGGEKLGL